MNLNKLFKTQAELDKRIVKEKRLQGPDLLDKKILALQVELGELANEWQLFKFWKDNPEPRTFKREKCPDCFEKGYYRGNPPSDEKRGVHGLGNHWYFCERCAGFLVIDRNPLLEEYVDCLHFILSIGNEGFPNHPLTEHLYHFQLINLDNTTDQFLHLFMEISGTISYETYVRFWRLFMGLGYQLGFTDGQVEQAYFEKNKVNHARQENGY